METSHATRQKETTSVLENRGVALAKQRQAPEVAQFLKEVVELGKKYGLSLSHEDHHSAFLVREYNEDDAYILQIAEDKTDLPLRTK